MVFRRSSEGRPHSSAPSLRATSCVAAPSRVGSSHWAPVPRDPACPALCGRLLSWPCLEGPWALHESICTRHWAEGLQDVIGLTLAAFYGSLCPGLPLNLITLMVLLTKTCFRGTATSSSYLSLVEIPKQPCQQSLPSPLYIGKDSDSEITWLAKDRARIQIQTWTQGSTDAPLPCLALPCLPGWG